MELVPVNAEALKRAIEAVSGPEATSLTLQAYAAIDNAMHYGHQLGFEQGYKASEAEHQNSYDDGYVAGVDERISGYEYTAREHQNSYDDGYVDGVDDARHDPEEADDYIAYLCSLDVSGEEFDELEPKVNAHAEREDWDFDPSDYTDIDDGGPYNESNVSDSGDVSDGAIYAAVSKSISG